MSDYREEWQLSFWEGFIREHPELRLGRPSRQPYQVVPPSLNTGVKIAAGMNRKREESIRVDVTLTNTPEEWFDKLRAERKTIEAEVGISDGRWEWDKRDGKAESHIILRKSVQLDGARKELYTWLAKAVDKFHKVFGPRISSFK